MQFSMAESATVVYPIDHGRCVGGDYGSRCPNDAAFVVDEWPLCVWCAKPQIRLRTQLHKDGKV